MTRTVAVLPHPDDEVFVAGALRAWGAQIVCATWGEAGVDLRGGRTGTALAAHRRGELEASCAALGLPPPVGLGLPDGGVEAADVAARLAEHLDGADRVVTLGRDGVYFHRDHLAVREGVLRATEGPVHQAVFARGLFHPLWRRLRKAGFAGVPRGLHPHRFGVDAPDLRVPVDPRWRVEAARCHASQLRGAPEDFLLPGLLTTLGDEDWFEVGR